MKQISNGKSEMEYKYATLRHNYLSWLCEHYKLNLGQKRDVDMKQRLDSKMSTLKQEFNYPNTNYEYTNYNTDNNDENDNFYKKHSKTSVFPIYNDKNMTGNYLINNDISGYSNDNNNNNNNYEQNEMNKIKSYDPTSPFYGMDPELIGFVQKHHVVMDDGAVINKAAILKKAAIDGKIKKQFQPPGGLSIKTFIILLVILIILIILIIIALAVGIPYAYKVYMPNLPVAQPWWRRTHIYQINVETWANDVQGPVGRLQDIIPRMAYLSSQVGATSILLTNLISSDINGIINWEIISQSVDPNKEAFSSLLSQLLKKSKSPMGKLKFSKPIKIMIGLPIYATSNQHEWFRVSQTDVNSVYASYYIWTSVKPTTDQQKRHYAYDTIRRAYYRHVHGNPNSPLLNLTNPNVQTEMINVIRFWKEKLEIKGVMITNSSNLLEEMVPSVKKIFNTDTDNEFVWFPDEPKIDAMVNSEEKVCLFTLAVNIRVPTRRDDIDSQIQQAMNNTQLRKCSPIWKVVQLGEDNKDFATIRKLAYFLPGSYLMMAGQEVDLVTGNNQLLKWSFNNYLDYTTYWPTNINLPQNGRQQLTDWQMYLEKVSSVSLMNTPIDKNTMVILSPKGTDNLLCVYRNYETTSHRVYFIVSFQTLNTIVHFQSVFYDLPASPKLSIIYDSKGVYRRRRYFGDEVLVNNQVLILYYY